MKRQIALAMALLVSAAASAAPPRAVLNQLKKIPAAGGISVYQRLQRCRIQIESSSSLEDGGSFTAPGEKQLNVFIDVPPIEDTPHDRALFTSLNAIWVIRRDGHVQPMTGWAKNLQEKFPLGSAVWMNC